MQRTGQILTMIVMAIAVVLTVADDADARRRRRRDLEDPGRDYTQGGFQLYAGFGSQSYDIDEAGYDYLEDFHDDEELVFIGGSIGLDRDLALYIEGAGSEHHTEIGDVAFGYAHIGLKYAFNTGYRHKFQPYIKGSIGGVFLWEDDDRRYNRGHDNDDNGYVGPSVGFGLGADMFVSRRSAIFAEIAAMRGEFDTVIVDGDDFDLARDIDVNSTRFLVGFRFRL